MAYTNIWIADDPIMNKSIINLSTEERYNDNLHQNLVLYSASFILGHDDLIVPYSEIADRMKVALYEQDRFYQWINISDSKVIYTKPQNYHKSTKT